MLAKSRGPDGRMLALTGKKELALTQQDWKESMLCDTCEHRLKTKYEDFLNEVFYLRRSKKPIFSGLHRVLLWGDTDRFALALISIFWRGAVALRREFREVFAPPYVLEDMRQWIHSGRISWDWGRLITIRVQEIRDAQGDTIAFLAPPFIRQTEQQQFEFVLICGGYVLTFALPVLPDEIYSRSKAVKPHSRVIRIERLYFREIREIGQHADEMLAAPMPEKLRQAIASRSGRRIGRTRG
ncbi:UNVERIFIED_ORG: hypothetical protein J2W38_007053 [Variovorax paradoxus]|nr:hypothetical protein [Variovorax paradoxus]